MLRLRDGSSRWFGFLSRVATVETRTNQEFVFSCSPFIKYPSRVRNRLLVYTPSLWATALEDIVQKVALVNSTLASFYEVHCN